MKKTEEKLVRVRIYAEGIPRKHTKQVSMGSRILNSIVHQLYARHSLLMLSLKL